MLNDLRRRLLNEVIIDVPEKRLDEISDKLLALQVDHTKLGLNQIQLKRDNVSILDTVLKEVIPAKLVPAQFSWLLTTANLDQPIATLLEFLKTNDADKYATFKAYILFARFYDYDQTIQMLAEAKPILLQAFPDLDLSDNTLLTLWRTASKF